jgi:hypothetical protein
MKISKPQFTQKPALILALAAATLLGMTTTPIHAAADGPGKDAVTSATAGGYEDPNQKAFGSVGFVFGQTLRLNISNILPAVQTPIGTGGTGDAVNAAPQTQQQQSSSCSAVLEYFDANGKVLKQTRISVAAGQSTFLDLSRTEFADTNTRAQVRATVFVPPGPCSEHLVASLEVIDPTGKTTVLYEDPNIRTIEDPNLRK